MGSAPSGAAVSAFWQLRALRLRPPDLRLFLSAEDCDPAEAAGCLGVPGEEVELVQEVVGLVEHGVTAAEHVVTGEVPDLVAKPLDLLDLRHGERHGLRVVLGGCRGADGKDAAEQLIWLLTQRGRGEEAQRLRRFGLNPDGSIAHA
jgi:hypothetical protein